MTTPSGPSTASHPNQPGPSPPAKVSSGPGAGKLTVVRWTSWPLVDEWSRCWPPLLAVVIVSLLVLAGTGSGELAALAVAIQLVALWRLLAPVRYELNARGVDQRLLGRVSHTPWSAIRQCQPLAAGLLLVGRRSGLLPSRRWRSLFLPVGRHRAAALKTLDAAMVVIAE